MNDYEDDHDFDPELWFSEGDSGFEEDETPPTMRGNAEFFMLELTPDDEAGRRLGEIQRPLATEYRGGRKKRPAFNIGAEAKAIVHGTSDPLSRQSATLLIYDFKFFSHRSTRIKDASISFEFKSKRGSRNPPPTVAVVAPYAKHVMIRTTETSTRTLGVAAGVQGGSLVNGNADAHGDWTVEKIRPIMLRLSKSGVVSLFRACILLIRQDNEDFYLYPTIKVTPDLKTQLQQPLFGFRRPDDPIKIVPTRPAVNKSIGKTITGSDLISEMNDVWDCTFYHTFEDAVKSSTRRSQHRRGLR
ncbi:hypothetical protein GGR57DRAFT_511818 [Xylariaceae sp. FL1272]|nr:hypothetical protein GGR57DRAFT_511818 [Xylariaceae sp. FL1272]